ncbi:hypothetical protein CHISP_2657 [Chitinispirillum alkaliphilum]|nr:hypothetical protein CHISP_2657 [Chitinispirillum alkaliphilum]
MLKAFPERTVAHLNIADAYLGLGQQEKVSEYFKKYSELMKRDGREKRIPQRVFDFIEVTSKN